MKKLIYTICLFSFCGCIKSLEPEHEHLPKKIIIECSKEENNNPAYWEKLMSYTSSGQLAKEQSFSYENLREETIFFYQDTLLVKTERLDFYNDKTITTNYIYDDKNQLIQELSIKTENDENNTPIDTNYVNYEYLNGKLFKRRNRWGTLVYEYNGNETKESFEDNNGHITRYEIMTYNNDDLLVSEEFYNSLNQLAYTQTYNYQDGLLLNIKKDNLTIDERTYENGLLIEKKTYEFGIDPCFYPCCGNFLYSYFY